MDRRFCLHPVILDDQTVFPCGRCPICRMKYRKQFALRIYMEKKLEKPFQSYFLTLTYNDENIPISQGRQCFCKAHLTRFLDSVRHHLRRYGLSLRYFATCEYGEEGYRPHYHLITFIYKDNGVPHRLDRSVFSDRHFFNREIVGRYWHYGYSFDGTVTGPSVMYCTAYALKDDEALERDWSGFEEGRPFRLFSLKPGLGLTDKCISWWFDYVFNDGYPRSSVTVSEARAISSGIPTGVKRQIKDRHPVPYEYIKDANMQYFEQSVSYLFKNAERYGSYRDYRVQSDCEVVEVDLAPDEQVKAFRKALRILCDNKSTKI